MKTCNVHLVVKRTKLKTILDIAHNQHPVVRIDRLISKTRVEHVFGFMEQSMNGITVRSVGIVRATGIIGLINLTYNFFRFEQVVRLNILQS